MNPTDNQQAAGAGMPAADSGASGAMPGMSPMGGATPAAGGAMGAAPSAGPAMTGPAGMPDAKPVR